MGWNNKTLIFRLEGCNNLFTIQSLSSCPQEHPEPTHAPADKMTLESKIVIKPSIKPAPSDI